MKNKLRELAERLEKATGPDRELDFIISYELGRNIGWGGNGDYFARHFPNASHEELRSMHIRSRIDDADGVSNVREPHFTASIDAALTLVERLLPWWSTAYVCQTDDGWTWEFRPPGIGQWHQGRATTTALAILRALVAALISKESTDAN